jgi:tetratricopeptide (TPR) repeat protein
MQDIDLLISLRFVIADIYQQLKGDQCQSEIRVHRFQSMTEEELKKLRRSEGKIISNNSFLSTSMDSSVAMIFCEKQSRPDLQRVLFTIDADPNVGTSKPFADISYLAEFHDEREILFMPGCLFRLMKIEHQNTTKGRIVNINMKLCGDSENNLKNLFDHMKKECRISADGNVTPLSFANLLYEMGKYDLAEKMYLRLNQELPSNDPSLLDLYWSFGMLYKATGNYDNSIMWFTRALEIYNQRNLRDYVRIGNLYNWIGESYRSKDENLTALTYFNNAERFFKTENDMNNPSLGHIYNNMGIVHKNLKNYSKALEFYAKSLAIRRKNLPEVHSDIASSYNNRANVYFQLRNYDQAMQYHKMALEMYIKACPAQHPDIGMSHQNIGQIHEKKREWKRAMEHYQKAVAIYRASLESDHPNVIHVQKDIKRVSLILK